MTPIENLHYAMGELAYAVASADGLVQHEERKAFHDIVAEELKCKNGAFDISSIIFQIMNKDKADSETNFNWAMKEIRLNGHYLSPELKATFLSVLEKVSSAFPPVTIKEQRLIEEIKKEFELITGDPVYYERSHLL